MKRAAATTYSEYQSKSNDPASVWQHFLRAGDGNTAKCKTCNSVMKTSGGNTSGLHKHLKAVHPTLSTKNNEKGASSDASCSNSNTDHKKPRKLTDFFSMNSMEDRVARMCALDGIPFRVFSKSNDMRQLFANSKQQLPKSVGAISEIVKKRSNVAKSSIKQEINALKLKGEKFSCTLDEWTSTRNRRYMNVNIHCPALTDPFRNLGLVRIVGSMPADKCITLLKQRLSEFDLSLENETVCLTTDACSLMCKVDREVPSLHQRCMAHGIQLALTDVFYQKKSKQNLRETGMTENEETGPVEENNETVQQDEEDCVQNIEDDDGGFEVLQSEDQESNGTQFVQNTLQFCYEEIINKVRQVARLYRKSPTKSDDILQKHVKNDIGKELTLILDCKTRWSSLADMLARFLQIKSTVKKSLIDINSDIKFSDAEIDILEHISESLQIMKITVEAICRREATLLTADTALKFCLRKLEAQSDNSYSTQLIEALTKRVKQFRLKESSLLQYLHNPTTYFENSINTDLFPTLSNEEINASIIELCERLTLKPASTSTTGLATKEETETPILSPEIELNREIEMVKTHSKSCFCNSKSLQR